MNLSTYSEQVTHYAAVRQRLMNPPRKVVKPVEAPQPAPEPEQPVIHADAFDLEESPLNPRWKIIMKMVCLRDGITIPEIMSARREKRLVKARDEIWWLISKQTTMTLPQIGKRFNKDHTTVLWGIRMHQKRLMAEEAENRLTKPMRIHGDLPVSA